MAKPKPYQIPEEYEKISCLNDVDGSLTYSYAHYLNWLFEDRVELIRGKVFPMSAPLRVHQEVSGAIFVAIANYLKNKPCKIYTAPFDVRFPKESKADRDVFTVLQPDLCVVCDESKLDRRGCIGAPDIVVEVLSAGNNKKELHNKYKVYEEFGVKEYWIVSTRDQTLLKYTLDEFSKYQPSKVHNFNEKITSCVLDGFILDLKDVFEN